MKRIALAIGAGIVATGAVIASAASLGTLNVKTLGTGTEAIVTCNSASLDISWNDTDPTYDPGTPTYTTADATITDTSSGGDCDGATVLVTVSDSGTSLAESTTATITGGSAPLVFAGGFDSEQADQVTVTVYNES